ncbi:pilin [Tahibacter amnicola]|uniref:Pilin n=1 Tax=Tahibacter amnicola TaxID=2976241 RepID=A0ABY6BFE5_9GAMM|nr:pilin [Tahibacter amnicola]UXI68749.1 pilin [Tahibacter amnicola]
MQRLALNFVVVFAAALAALLLHDYLRGSRTGGDFGVGARQERDRVLESDFRRAADPARVALAEFYFSHGTWPSSNAQAGLPEPSLYRGESLRTLAVSGSTITLTFDGRSGVDGGQIILRGETTPELAMGIHWECISPNLPDIATALPHCVHRRPGG